MNSLTLNEYRCRCGKLLLKGLFFNGTLEIKCKRCGEINRIGSTKHLEDDTHYLVIINQQNGLIVNINDIGCRVLGYSKEELVGKHFTLINSDLPERIADKIFGDDSILDSENHFRIDTVHRNKAGEEIPVIANLKLFKPNEKESFSYTH